MVRKVVCMRKGGFGRNDQYRKKKWDGSDGDSCQEISAAKKAIFYIAL